MGFYSGRKSIKQDLFLNNDSYISTFMNENPKYGPKCRIAKEYNIKQSKNSTSNSKFQTFLKLLKQKNKYLFRISDPYIF